MKGIVFCGLLRPVLIFRNQSCACVEPTSGELTFVFVSLMNLRQCHLDHNACRCNYSSELTDTDRVTVHNATTLPSYNVTLWSCFERCRYIVSHN